MSTVNVDELSDAQIRQLMQNAQSSGLSDAQLIQTAQTRGMSSAQIQRLQARVADIRSKEGSAGFNGSSPDTAQARGRNYGADTIKNAPQGNREDLFASIQPRIFGATLFRNTKVNSFEPNLKLPTPVNYILGPGDILNIEVYGNSIANWKLAVSPEGNISIPGVGPVNVTGKTIEATTALIRRTLIANRYAIGRGTELKVTLGDIRSIKVLVQGQVMRPGTYTLSSLSTVFFALYAAGGPNDIGSFRDIEVIRDNRIIRHLDLYDFLVKGSQKDNIGLKDQDLIRVPSYRLRAELKGEVKIPAIFEVLPGETLQTLLDFSGGFTDEAYTARIKINQVSDQQRRITEVLEADFKSYIPLRGDRFVVERILDRFENRVVINGAVFRPGQFELQKGLTVSQLIKNAGGLKEDAFTGRASIIRLNPDNTTQQISFNLFDAINKAGADIALQREDIITISSLFDLRDKYRVAIQGEVRNPGDFAYADSMKVADLIVLAGGFSEGASAKRIEVSRRVFDSDPRAINSKVAQIFTVDVNSRLQEDGMGFTLKPFDIVSIYALPGYETQKVVYVEGEVLYPGPFTIQKKNEKISDILKRAGGLTSSADVDGSSLKRDNEAILGVSKSKADANAERNARLRQFQRTYSTKDIDSVKTNTDTAQLRNNYIGINLRKILKDPGVGDDIILENGDVLRIPKQQQIVKVNGEVLYPSAIVYSKGKSFRGYVLNSGGYSARALKRGGYIVYANGSVKATRKFLFFNVHPSVKPGAEIYVPKKLPSPATTVQTILGFTTGLASLGAIILGIVSLNK
ncbi:SLBB domain-containing protein [Mucilaginibacter calamicampi]|uniref:SLBB domain-containing protein n=2 Tax=Mucilaginibacter calamicampi TaxID=1302352 RepID=A0ABW2YZ03_9SPHI